MRSSTDFQEKSGFNPNSKQHTSQQTPASVSNYLPKGVVLKAKTNKNRIYVVSIISMFSGVEQNPWQQIIILYYITGFNPNSKRHTSQQTPASVSNYLPKGAVLKAKTNKNRIYVVSIMSMFSSVEQNPWQQIIILPYILPYFLDFPHKYTL